MGIQVIVEKEEIKKCGGVIIPFVLMEGYFDEEEGVEVPTCMGVTVIFGGSSINLSEVDEDYLWCDAKRSEHPIYQMLKTNGVKYRTV